MSGRAYMSMCDRCFDRIGKTRIIQPASREYIGTCPQCGTKTRLIQYEVGPTYHELEIRRRMAAINDKKRNTGGGERARAERRRA